MALPLLAKLLPIVQGAMKVGENFLNRRAAKKENERQRKWAAGQAELAYQRDQDMWHMQNEYNDPRQQMMRLDQAGLNPNLVYGANAPGNQSGSAPTYTPAQGQFGLPQVQLPELLSMYQNFEMKNAQIQNVKAGTDNINARTDLERYGLGYRQELDPYNLDIAKSKKTTSALGISKMMQSIRNMSQQEKNMLMDELIKNKTIKQQDLDYEIKQEERQSRESINLLKKYGATENDPLLMRMLLRLFDSGRLQQVLPEPRSSDGRY